MGQLAGKEIKVTRHGFSRSDSIGYNESEEYLGNKMDVVSFSGINKLILINPSPYLYGEGADLFGYRIFFPGRKLWVR